MSNLNNLFVRLNLLGISAKTLSENTHISTGNISDWKSGRSFPTAKKLIDIADYLDCSIDYLVGRTDVVEVNRNINKFETEPVKNIIIPLFENSASAGTGLYLFDDIPATYVTVEKTEKTQQADFIIKVKGDSMTPKFSEGDTVLVKKSSVITEGSTGIFILNGEAYIKKMGRGELISLNSAYKPIKLTEYDDVSCAGIVIDKIDLNNYT